MYVSARQAGLWGGICIAAVSLSTGCADILGIRDAEDGGAAGASAQGGSGTGGGGATSTTSAGGTGGTGNTNSTGGSEGVGGSGGTGNNGGAGGTTSTSTGTPMCPLDLDGDLAISWKCAGGTDCADDDPNTHPGITDHSSTPIQNESAPGTLPFDKNCDGVEEPEIPVLGCNFGDCASTPLGFKAEVPCGETAALGHCAKVALFGCEWQAENPPVMMAQKCK